MPKSADAFRTISEVADWLETPAHVLRFWESKFSQVKPVKRAGGRRYYRPADMKLLGGIKKLLHDDGMTIKGVQKMLREQGVGYVSDFSQPLGDAADDVLISRTEDASTPETRVEEPRSPTTSVEATPATASSREAPPPGASAPETASSEDDTPELTFSRRPSEPAPIEEPETEEPLETAGDDSPPLPSFLHRREAPNAPDDTPPSSAPEEDDASSEAPAPKPSVVDVPDDPDDSISADPGVLSRLAGLSRPLTPAMAKQLETLAAKLRATTGSTAKD